MRYEYRVFVELFYYQAKNLISSFAEFSVMNLWILHSSHLEWPSTRRSVQWRSTFFEYHGVPVLRTYHLSSF